jgi:dihydrofolate reductase
MAIDKEDDDKEDDDKEEDVIVIGSMDLYTQMLRVFALTLDAR